jgi:hypothetical protein
LLVVVFRRQLRDPNEPSAVRGRELYHESEALYSKICSDVKRLVAIRNEAEHLSHVRNPLSESDQKSVRSVFGGRFYSRYGTCNTSENPNVAAGCFTVADRCAVSVFQRLAAVQWRRHDSLRLYAVASQILNRV